MLTAKVTTVIGGTWNHLFHFGFSLQHFYYSFGFSFISQVNLLDYFSLFPRLLIKIIKLINFFHLTTGVKDSVAFVQLN